MMVAPDDQQPAAKLKDIEEYPYWPKTDDQKTRQALEEKACKAGKIAKRIHEETDYAISGVHEGADLRSRMRVDPPLR